MRGVARHRAEEHVLVLVVEDVGPFHAHVDDARAAVSLGRGYQDLAIPYLPFAEALHRDRGVLVIPGAMFESPGALRVSWLQAAEGPLAQGLEQIRLVLSG